MITTSERQFKRSSSHSKLKSHGYSLIEVLMVISLSSILMGIVVAAMASFLRLDRKNYATRRSSHRVAAVSFVDSF